MRVRVWGGARIGGRFYTHRYEYNDEEQNTVIVNPDGGEFHFDFDEEGRVIIIGAPNQTSGSYDYDDNGRVTKVNLLKHDGSTIVKYVYEYDANNNRTKVTDHTGKTIHYTYDEQDQLISETDPMTGNTLHYTYDAVGNRTSKVIVNPRGEHVYTVKYEYNRANQLTAVQDKSFTYDIHGNLTEDTDKKYLWDDTGRLIEIKKKETGQTVATLTLIEEVLIYILEENNIQIKSKGDIQKLYCEVKEVLNMRTNRDYDRSINSMLTGLEKIIQAVAEMRNSNSDSHGAGRKRIAIRKIEAELVINAAITFGVYLLGVYENSQEKEVQLC